MGASKLLEALKEPFDERIIHWRVGATTKDKDKGIALAYLNARDVMKRLDEACGIEGWACVYTQCAGTAVCELSILIDGTWIVKSDGAGATDVEGEKGMLSDAFKRAAVRFGVGRYLYYLSNEWVPIKEAGRSYKLVAPPKLPYWAKPKAEREKIGLNPVNHNKVNEAIKFFKRKIDEDSLEDNYESIQTLWKGLSTDEGLAVTDELNDKALGSRKKYKSLLSDYLDFRPEGN